MPKVVVDGFEVIQVDQQQRGLDLILLPVLGGSIHNLIKSAAVQQSGESIMQGCPAITFFLQFSFSDVPEGADITLILTSFTLDGRSMNLQPDLLAISADAGVVGFKWAMVCHGLLPVTDQALQLSGVNGFMPAFATQGICVIAGHGHVSLIDVNHIAQQIGQKNAGWRGVQHSIKISLTAHQIAAVAIQ